MNGNRKTILWIVGGVAIMALAVLAWQGALAGTAQPSSETPPPSWAQDEINRLEAQVDQASDPQAQQSLEGKLDILREQEAARVTAFAVEPEKPADPCQLRPPETQPDAPVETGIIPGKPVLMPGTSLEVQNLWIGMVHEQWVGVYATLDIDTSGQAVIVVRYDNSDGGGEYPAPENTGPLLIVAEDNQRLTLESADGQQFFFDVPGETFVASLDEVVPAVEPAPTYTPTPDPCAP